MAQLRSRSVGHDAVAVDSRTAKSSSRSTCSEDAVEQLGPRSLKHRASRPGALAPCCSSEPSVSSGEELSADDRGSAEESGPASVRHVLWLGGRRIEVSPASALSSGGPLASEGAGPVLAWDAAVAAAPSDRPAGTSGSGPPRLVLSDEEHPSQIRPQVHPRQMRDLSLQVAPQRVVPPELLPKRDASVQVAESVASNVFGEPAPLGVAPEEEETSDDDAAQLQQASVLRQAAAADLQTAVAKGEAPLPPGVPSVGSMLHGTPECRPCFYAHIRKGCRFGAACLFCHEAHSKKRKPRPPKHVREDCKSAAKVAFKELGGTSPQEAEAWLLQQQQQQSGEQDEKAAGYTLAVLRALFKTRADPADPPSAVEHSDPASDGPRAAAPPSSSTTSSPVAPTQAAPAETAVPMPRTLRQPRVQMAGTS